MRTVIYKSYDVIGDKEVWRIYYKVQSDIDANTVKLGGLKIEKTHGMPNCTYAISHFENPPLKMFLIKTPKVSNILIASNSQHRFFIISVVKKQIYISYQRLEEEDEEIINGKYDPTRSNVFCVDCQVEELAMITLFECSDRHLIFVHHSFTTSLTKMGPLTVHSVKIADLFKKKSSDYILNDNRFKMVPAKRFLFGNFDFGKTRPQLFMKVVKHFRYGRCLLLTLIVLDRLTGTRAILNSTETLFKVLDKNQSSQRYNQFLRQFFAPPPIPEGMKAETPEMIARVEMINEGRHRTSNYLLVTNLFFVKPEDWETNGQNGRKALLCTKKFSIV